MSCEFLRPICICVRACMCSSVVLWEAGFGGSVLWRGRKWSTEPVGEADAALYSDLRLELGVFSSSSRASAMNPAPLPDVELRVWLIERWASNNIEASRKPVLTCALYLRRLQGYRSLRPQPRARNSNQRPDAGEHIRAIKLGSMISQTQAPRKCRQMGEMGRLVDC